MKTKDKNGRAAADLEGYRGIAIDLSPQAIETLKFLRRTGLYGATIEEVAERLLCEQIRQFVQIRGK